MAAKVIETVAAEISISAPARLYKPTGTQLKLDSEKVAPQNSTLTSGSYLTLFKLSSSFSLTKFCLHWA